jgi:hypothetical protein
MPGSFYIFNQHIEQYHQLQILKLHGVAAIQADDPIILTGELATAAPWAV